MQLSSALLLFLTSSTTTLSTVHGQQVTAINHSKASKKDGHDDGTKSSKSAPDLPNRDGEWLSNLQPPGQCITETSFKCSDTTFGPWGYYLACFNNPKNYDYITGIRFWTESSYGVREGIGAQISIYYGSKAGGPFVTGVGSPFSFARLDVPVTTDPQTTFIPGQNNTYFGWNK